MCWLVVLAKSPDGFYRLFCFDLSLDSVGKNAQMSISGFPLPSQQGKLQHKLTKLVVPSADILL